MAGLMDYFRRFGEGDTDLQRGIMGALQAGAQPINDAINGHPILRELGVRGQELAEAALPGASDVLSMMQGSKALMQGKPGEAAYGALGMMPFVPNFMAPIKAWHGTPHSFDKFEMSKIGTGEGNQSFGHGLYFAENRKVAEDYQKKLGDVDFRIKGEPALLGDANLYPKEFRPQNAAANMIKAYGGDLDAVHQDLARQMADPESFYSRMPDVKRHVDSVKSYLDTLSPADVEFKTKGNLYETTLKAEPEQFLDWDAPLHEQPTTILDALQKLGIKTDVPDVPIEASKSGKQFSVFHPGGWELAKFNSREKAEKFAAEFRNDYAKTEHTGQKAYRRIDANRVKAAAKLKDAGIPGIKYLDGISQGTGDGTRNFVMFDDALVNIDKVHR